MIAQHCDAVLYVVRWDRTPKAQITEGLKLLRAVNAPVAGLVLSQVDEKAMKRRGYGREYGAYSRAARGYYEA